MFDERVEPRERNGSPAELDWRGSVVPVILADLSESGAMLLWSGSPDVGESVTLRAAGNHGRPGSISWVRDGRVGIYFATPLV